MLLACGVALAAGAAPATAAGGHDGAVAAAQRPGIEDRGMLAGLPMPDLAAGPPVDAAKAVGRALADRAKAAGVSAVVLDRGGYRYHGRVRSLAEGAREGGLDL